MAVIGIDPGKSGGIAVLGDGVWLATKMPETDVDVYQLLMQWRDSCKDDAMVYLESVHAMPKQGVTSTFTFGQNFGALKMAVVALGMRLEMVTPQRWQKAMGCMSRGDKNVTKRKAQELFPGVKITHAVADALLIAEFGRRQQ